MLARFTALPIALALVAALPGSASAAATGTPMPMVEKITPAQQVNVGDVLEIRGLNFFEGPWRNQVVFVRAGIRPVFVLADEAQDTVIRVRVPAKLLAFIEHRDGQPVPTRFRMTVMSDRLNPEFVPSAKVPLIAPPGTAAPVPAGVDCDGNGAVDIALPQQLGVPVVGLALPGLPALGTEPTWIPDIAGMPGIPDLGLPAFGLPKAATPEPPGQPRPVCPPPPPPPPPPAADNGDDDEDSETTTTTTTNSDGSSSTTTTTKTDEDKGGDRKRRGGKKRRGKK